MEVQMKDLMHEGDLDRIHVDVEISTKHKQGHRSVYARTKSASTKTVFRGIDTFRHSALSMPNVYV